MPVPVDLGNAFARNLCSSHSPNMNISSLEFALLIIISALAGISLLFTLLLCVFISARLLCNTFPSLFPYVAACCIPSNIINEGARLANDAL